MLPTGILLIDRNDELCILYEKAHVQDKIVAEGTAGLQQLDNHVRVLNLEIAELERSIQATRRSMPEMSTIDEEVAKLRVRTSQGMLTCMLVSP